MGGGYTYSYPLNNIEKIFETRKRAMKRLPRADEFRMLGIFGQWLIVSDFIDSPTRLDIQPLSFQRLSLIIDHPALLVEYAKKIIFGELRPVSTLANKGPPPGAASQDGDQIREATCRVEHTNEEDVLYHIAFQKKSISWNLRSSTTCSRCLTMTLRV